MRAGSATLPGRRCTKLSPIESLLQYRFATPKPLKARPGPGGCRIAPLCKPRPGGDPPTVAVPPFPSSTASPQARPAAVPSNAHPAFTRAWRGAKRGEANPLTARTGPYNLALVAAAEPPSIRALDSLILFPQGQPLLLPVNFLFVLLLVIVRVLARTSEGEVRVLARTIGPISEGLSTWKNPSIHGQMWKTAPGTKNGVL